jgi:hypothetical protein
MITYYRDVYGDYPKSIEELQSSGLSPVNADSINPVTGTPFRFDGAANDVSYRYFAPRQTEHGFIGGYELQHVDADGRKSEIKFSY